jgi:hypothetical protein
VEAREVIAENDEKDAKTMIRVLATVVPIEGALHEDDENVPGVYGILLDDGPNGHPMTPRAPTEEGDDATIEAAKDVFHDHVGIHVLDDFTITFEVQGDDVDLSTREDVTWL